MCQRQVASAGTFLLPVLVEDCGVPPLLAHRRFADFRNDYEAGLGELLELFGRDARAAEQAGKKLVHPWPDLEVSDREFIYLHSTRFDKFFRMNCELKWTADRTLDYIVTTLSLPWRKEIPELGMRWSFRYSLMYEGHSVPLRKTLVEAGIAVGSTYNSAFPAAMKTYMRKRSGACGSRARYTISRPCACMRLRCGRRSRSAGR